MTKFIKTIILSILGVMILVGGSAFADVTNSQTSSVPPALGFTGTVGSAYDGKQVKIEVPLDDRVLNLSANDYESVRVYDYYGGDNQKWNLSYDSSTDTYTMYTAIPHTGGIAFYHLGVENGQVVVNPSNFDNTEWKIYNFQVTPETSRIVFENVSTGEYLSYYEDADNYSVYLSNNAYPYSFFNLSVLAD